MANTPATIEIIGTRDKKRCLAIMDQIQNARRPVAVDAEGIKLSAKGRMTLLQLCTMEKKVYLIDLIDPHDPDNVQPAEDLIKNGGVKAMLESSSVLKVFQCCKSDSAALYHQFDVRLRVESVFDTQTADMAVQKENDNIFFPHRRSLNHIAEMYGCPSNSLKDEHAGWMQENQELWGQRPLTNKMISYAAQDVIVLVPEIHEILHRKLDAAAAWDEYKARLDEFINSSIKEERTRIFAQMNQRTIKAARSVLEETMHTRYPDSSLDSLTDDERFALKQLQNHKDTLQDLLRNGTIAALEEKCCLCSLEEWELEQQQNPHEFKLSPFNFTRLKTMIKHSRQRVRQTARRIRQRQIDWNSRHQPRAVTQRKSCGGRRYSGSLSLVY